MRKAQAKKLPLAPDPRFNDKLVTRFVNNLMWEGKKSGAFNIFYDALDKVEKMTSENGYEVWKRALVNVTPAVEVRSRRIGGGEKNNKTKRKFSFSLFSFFSFSSFFFLFSSSFFFPSLPPPPPLLFFFSGGPRRRY